MSLTMEASSVKTFSTGNKTCKKMSRIYIFIHANSTIGYKKGKCIILQEKHFFKKGERNSGSMQSNLHKHVIFTFLRSFMHPARCFLRQVKKQD